MATLRSHNRPTLSLIRPRESLVREKQTSLVDEHRSMEFSSVNEPSWIEPETLETTCTYTYRTNSFLE
jgi:hypothetical protein